MGWVLLATLSAAFMAMVSVLDKHIIERHVSDVRTFYMVIAIFNLPVGILLLVLFPLMPATSPLAISLAIAGGLSMSVALMLIWLSFRTEEVSRVIPVTQTFPIFVAVMAAVFLKETIDVLDWLAILFMVFGAVLISAQRTPGGRIFLSRSFPLLLLASLAFAISQIVSKEALNEMSRWNMLGLYMIALPLGFSIIALRRPYLIEAITLIRRPAPLSWFVTNQIGAFLGNLTRFAAFAVGPVALASAVFATRPLFIFIYTVLLSWRLPSIIREPLTAPVLILKLMAIAMIVGGGSLIVID